jgi:hypothetical protein
MRIRNLFTLDPGSWKEKFGSGIIIPDLPYNTTYDKTLALMCLRMLGINTYVPYPTVLGTGTCIILHQPH